MRQLRGRPRLYDLNRRRSSNSAGTGQSPDAVAATPRVSGMGTLTDVEDLLFNVTSEGESEWDALELYSIDLQRDHIDDRNRRRPSVACCAGDLLHQQTGRL